MLAIYLYIYNFLQKKRLVNIVGIFGLSFVGAYAISFLKLSNLSTEYNIKMIVSVFVSYFSIYLGAKYTERKTIVNFQNFFNKKNESTFKSKISSIIYYMVIVITFLFFLIEVKILGFIPIFMRNTPHAYSTFHVFMLHYITCFFVFLPSIAIINYYNFRNKKNFIKIIFSYIYVFFLSILMTSRSGIINSTILSILTYVILNNDILLKKNFYNKKHLKLLFIFFMIIVLFMCIITINRGHSINYLNEIFDMKNKNLPIFITQPYMYIAHNFENLNYMIQNIEHFTFGKRFLTPLFTITLVKKFFPLVVNYTPYFIKEELTTVTLIYDFYYDFGIIGVILFCFLIGFVGQQFENIAYENKKYFILFYAQFSFYLLFSFFQSYFSLTSTWVDLVFLFFISKICDFSSIKIKKNNLT